MYVYAFRKSEVLGARGKAQKHKQSLNKLKENDPEFYKFLKDEDTTLLDFDPDEVSGNIVLFPFRSFQCYVIV